MCRHLAGQAVLVKNERIKCKKGVLIMDQKTEIMVSLGTAIGANCIPCFDYIYAKAKEVDLEESEIQKTVEVAFKVKNGAQASRRMFR